LPVYKHVKKSIRDVSINNGLHYGGIARNSFFLRTMGVIPPRREPSTK
jgi:hypothetical protein